MSDEPQVDTQADTTPDVQPETPVEATPETPEAGEEPELPEPAADVCLPAEDVVHGFHVLDSNGVTMKVLDNREDAVELAKVYGGRVVNK
jgi:hypothetical protein